MQGSLPAQRQTENKHAEARSQAVIQRTQLMLIQMKYPDDEVLKSIHGYAHCVSLLPRDYGTPTEMVWEPTPQLIPSSP